jgi:hypothetical protein
MQPPPQNGVDHDDSEPSDADKSGANEQSLQQRRQVIEPGKKPVFHLGDPSKSRLT